MPFSLLLILTLLFLSWLSIYTLEKRNIFKDWSNPPLERFKEFGVGFLFMGLLCVISNVFLSEVNGTAWTVSESATINKFIYSIGYDINSVLIEELLFRGAILYLLIKFTDEQIGVVISALAFGIYHWFSYGVMGNTLGMILVLITTGFMGYVFALAYVKTQSITLPTGLHFGWNWIHNSIFSQGALGAIFLTSGQPEKLGSANPVFSFFLYLLVPSAVFLLINSDLFDRISLKQTGNPN